MNSQTNGPKTESEKRVIESTTLIALKSEVHRKLQEAQTISSSSSRDSGAPLRLKRSLVPQRKRKDVDETLRRLKNKASELGSEIDPESEEGRKLLESRRRLEAKARLYDQLANTKEALGNRDISDFYLVNFEEKILNQDDEDESSFDDAQRLRKEMQVAEKYKGFNMQPFVAASASGTECLDVDESPDSTGLGPLGPVRYQEALGDEIRTHGAGYFAFSTEEAIRHSQQEALRRLHEDAEVAQSRRAKKTEARNKAMAKRLQKVRDRRMLRAGLPLPKSSLEGDEEEEAYNASLDGEASGSGDASASTRSEIPLPPKEVDPVREAFERRKRVAEEKAALEEAKERERKKRVRPWDVGKEGVMLSQESWVEKQREERNPDFAPPSSYSGPSFRGGAKPKMNVPESVNYAFQKGPGHLL